MSVKNKTEHIEESADMDHTVDPVAMATRMQEQAMTVHREALRNIADAILASDMNAKAVHAESAYRAQIEADEWMAVAQHFASAGPRP